MTLQEWSDKTGIMPTHPTTETGAVSLCWNSDMHRDTRAELWHLSDYKVSSAGAIVVWLVPRKEPEPHPCMVDIEYAITQLTPISGLLFEVSDRVTRALDALHRIKEKLS